MALRIFKAALSYALLGLAAGFVLGTLRVLVIAPRIGELAAVSLEAPVMLAISAGFAIWCAGRFHLKGLNGALLAMGLAAFLMLQFGEILLAGAFGPLGFVENAGAYALNWGSQAKWVGLAAQIVFGFLPYLLAKRTDNAKR